MTARRFVREWVGPGALGLAGAALLIAGTEAGGWVAWATLAAAWIGLAVFVGYLVRHSALADLWDDEDEPPAP